MKIYSDLMDNDNLSNIQPGDLVVDYWINCPGCKKRVIVSAWY